MRSSITYQAWKWVTYDAPEDGHLLSGSRLNDIERDAVSRLAVQADLEVGVDRFDGLVVRRGPGVAAAGSVEKGLAGDDDFGDWET